MPAPTRHAPAERSSPRELAAQVRRIEQSELFQVLLEAYDDWLAILNPERQVLAANRTLLDDLGVETLEELVGSRVGEAWSCIHAHDGPGGCGTGMACRTCGAVNAILAAQRTGRTDTRECLVTTEADGHTAPLELRVRVHPTRVGQSDYLVVSIRDISQEKRLAALERTFFHDLINTAGGVEGWGRLLAGQVDVEPDQAGEHIVSLARRMVEEIECHRSRVQAERGDLEPDLRSVPAGEVLEAVREVFAESLVGREPDLRVEPTSATLVTDPVVLRRVLVNMVKNALEASDPGEEVRVWHEPIDGGHRFCVANPGVMPEAVATRIFQRSFTTKGSGRGLGTWSMKLFGERFLGGEVHFRSEEGLGTRFCIDLPGEPANGHPSG